jgi:hypothetical protein
MNIGLDKTLTDELVDAPHNENVFDKFKIIGCWRIKPQFKRHINTHLIIYFFSSLQGLALLNE